MSTYSFLSIKCAIVGPGGSINLAAGAASAEEGITIAATEDINTMTVAADGEVMHSLHANKSGTITARFLKTSPVNQLLMAMYNFQTAFAANHGQNTITLTNPDIGDSVAHRIVAFKKAPDLTYAKEGGLIEWIWDCGKIDRALGGNV